MSRATKLVFDTDSLETECRLATVRGTGHIMQQPILPSVTHHEQMPHQTGLLRIPRSLWAGVTAATGIPARLEVSERPGTEQPCPGRPKVSLHAELVSSVSARKHSAERNVFLAQSSQDQAAKGRHLVTILPAGNCQAVFWIRDQFRSRLRDSAGRSILSLHLHALISSRARIAPLPCGLRYGRRVSLTKDQSGIQKSVFIENVRHGDHLMT